MKFIKLILILFAVLMTTNPAVAADDFEDFHFTEIFDTYFNADHEISTWDMLTMARELYETKMGSLIFWTLMFVSVYFALHLTTGGTFIPSAVFAAVGSILVLVMPSELSVWMQLILVVGLFIIPIYRYFKD
jgi:hypothetical protein